MHDPSGQGRGPANLDADLPTCHPPRTPHPALSVPICRVYGSMAPCRPGGNMMEAYICRRCGVQYAPSDGPPERCPICEDERECVAWGGQQWTTLAELIAEGRQNHLQEEEPGLFSVDT